MRIPNIQDNQRYLCVYMYILLGKSQILGKFISLGLFLLQDTAGSTAFVEEYPKYSSDLGLEMASDLNKEGNILNTQVNCPKVTVKWQSLPYQHRKSPNLQGQSLCHCMLIEEINQNFFHSNFSARQRHTG